MGWSYDDRTEFFTLDDLVEKFSLAKLNPSPAAINFSKLVHFNKVHIKELSDSELAVRILPYFEKAGLKASLIGLEKIAPVLKDRMVTLDDSVNFCAFFFKEDVAHDKEALILHDTTLEGSIKVAKEISELCESIQNWTLDSIEKAIKGYMEENDLTPKQLFSYLREAISGQRVTPPLFECMVVLGKETTMHRLNEALEELQG